jgi:FMN phosphatase YigB (HAD superfamily)
MENFMNIQKYMTIFILMTQAVNAEIRETKYMQDVMASIDRETLTIFDIDNTLIEPTGNMGSDQWFYYLIKIYKMEGKNEVQAGVQAMRAWNVAQTKIQIQSVESKTPDSIQHIQKQKIHTLAITARTLDIADRTVEQLKSVHIQLDTLSMTTFPMSAKAFQLKEDALYKKGILFVGENNSKGVVLMKFLEHHHFKPKRIVYVDDKLKHVQNLETVLAGTGIQYLGFRYAALDQKVKHYQDLMAEVQDASMVKLFLLGQI